MTDRNDELLLKIGWKYAVIEHDIDGVIHPRVRWTSPKGKVFGDGPIGTPSIGKLPRPYDSVVMLSRVCLAVGNQVFRGSVS